jgi:hypothetical protein
MVTAARHRHQRKRKTAALIMDKSGGENRRHAKISSNVTSSGVAPSSLARRRTLREQRGSAQRRGGIIKQRINSVAAWLMAARTALRRATTPA